MTTLKGLEAALREPFAAEDIQFKPKNPRPKGNGWECLALPYADKRVYEDRLNALAYGEWSTPSNQPIVAGDQLVLLVTVMICGVAHTDLGEVLLESAPREGQLRPEENSATEAYSQGFRCACAQFGLGRYLSSLPTLWLPYDKQARTIIVQEGERIAWVEKLYMQAGLSPHQKRTSSSHVPKMEETTAAPTGTSQKAHTQSSQASRPAHLVDEKLLHWLQKTLTNKQRNALYTHYKISNLADLTQEQADRAAQRLLDLELEQTNP